MVTMENAEEVMQILDRFTRLKQKEIPKELDEYLGYVAKTGDTVFKWASLKYLFREKLLNVIKNFHDTTPRLDEIPQYPNVDPFNYESMKSSLLERLELFNAAPFTIQRLCELLIDPRKQYSRIDKFMRALEKNILVVSTVEPGRKRTESENGDSLDSVVNGDLSLDVNVDIDMEADGLFNNAENTNGNGTASKAEVEAAKDEAKPEEKSLTKNTHSNDDENLPNPKKAKLDLNEGGDQQQDESKVEKNEVVNEEQKMAESKQTKEEKGEQEDVKKTECEEKSVENKDEFKEQQTDLIKTENEKGVLKPENKMKDVEMLEKVEEKKNIDAKETNEDLKEAVQEKKVVDEKCKEELSEPKTTEKEVKNNDEITKKNEVAQAAKSGKAEEKQDDDSMEVDGKAKSANQNEKKVDVSEEEKKVECSSETVVEKQELEKGEKDEIAEGKCKIKETETSENNAEKQEKSDKVYLENIEKVDEIKEIKQKATENEQEEVDKQDIPQDRSEEKKEAILKEKAKVGEHKEPIETLNENKTEPKQTEAKKPEEISKLEDKSKKTDEKTFEEPTKTEKELKEDSKKITEQQQKEDLVVDKQKTTQEEDIKETRTGSTATVTEEKTILPDTELKKQIETAVAEKSSGDIKEDGKSTAPTIIATPSPLTINDQLMVEDVAIEEACPTVEEVVMAEPPPTKGADSPSITVAMATDESSTINAKAEEEPSGMEVDDTSQEAMDQ